MYVLFIISLALSVSKNIVSKVGKKQFGNLSGLLTVNLFTGALAVVFFACLGLNFRVVSGGAFWTITLLYGLFTTASQMLHITAVGRGDLSVCTMIYASGFLVSTIFSVFYFNETVGVWKAIGLVLTCVSIFLISFQFKKKGEKKEKSGSYKYLFFSIPAMISCGVVGILQKLYGDFFGSVGLNESLFLAFLEMILLSAAVKLVIYMVSKRKSGEAVEFPNSAQESAVDKKKELIRFCLLAAAFAACIVLTNRFNLYLTGVMDGVIFFPVYNGGSIAITAACSFLLLKEKPTVFKLVGILIGILSFVLIAL